jgi:hypothetical protein
MKLTLLFSKTFSSILLATIVIACNNSVSAYFWRAVATNNVYTNVSNWETAPGNGISPALAPSVNDNVFFPVISNFTTIDLNNGNSRDFNVTTNVPSVFTFTNKLTAINGSLLCPNGTAVFQQGQNFTGTGAHSINMGTSSVAMGTLGGTILFASTANGTYSLLSNFYTGANIDIQSQSLNTNNFNISARNFFISNGAVKTMNFGSSTITLNSAAGFTCVFIFQAANANTTYNLSSTTIVINNVSLTATGGVQINGGISVNLGTLTLNSSGAIATSSIVASPVLTSAPCTLNITNVNVNCPNVGIGRQNIYNEILHTIVSPFTVNLSITNLTLYQPSTLSVDYKANITLTNLIEPNACLGQSVLLGRGLERINLNATTPITTTLAFYGINNIGSALIAPTNANLGLNTNVSFTSVAQPSNTFHWVGNNGNWNDPTQWSILGSGGISQLATGCLPTINDNVFFDVNSFTANQTVTITGQNAYCANITFSGVNRGAITGGGIYINGNSDFTGARVVQSELYFVGSGTNTITSGTVCSFTTLLMRIMGSGTFTLLDDFNSASPFNTQFQHTSGTFDSGTKAMNVANWSSRSYPFLAINARNVNISQSTINIRKTQLLGGGVLDTSFIHVDASFLNSFNGNQSNFILHINAATFTVARTSTSPAFLNTLNFNNVSFVSPIGIARLATRGKGGYTVNFNDINFSSSGQIINAVNNTITHNVNNYNFTNGNTYSANAQNPVFNVLAAINTVTSPCQDMIRIQSITAGTRVNLRKTTAPFNVTGALVEDINASSVVLNVVNGVDVANNLNVAVSVGVGRKMYWVNNSGNWSDGSGHWSIGVSGGNPAINNPSGCIPRQIDDVIFDNNSFSINNAIVTLNIDGNARSCVWSWCANTHF